MFNRIILFFIIFVLAFSSVFYFQPANAAESAFQYGLQKELVTYIKKQKGTITVQYTELTTNESFSYNSNQPAAAASTLKLPQALYIMELVDSGKVSLNEKLTYRSRHYYGGSGNIQYEKVGSTYTVRELIRRSIVYSDNIAYIMLMERVGKQNFIQYMKRSGGTYVFPQGKSTTSAKDLAIYASMLYKYAEKNENGKELVKHLKNTIYNTTIPAGIKGAEVAHKVGMIPMNLIYNDIAIVYDEKPYVLAITTSGLGYDYSQKVIANIATIIHKHHKKKYENYLSITTKVIRKNTNKVDVYSQQAVLINNRLMVPMRETLDAIDAKIEWNDKTKIAVVKKDHIEIVIPMNSKRVSINNEMIKMDVEVQNLNGHTFIPLRFISEALNAKVNWNSKTKTVEITE